MHSPVGTPSEGGTPPLSNFKGLPQGFSLANLKVLLSLKALRDAQAARSGQARPGDKLSAAQHPLACLANLAKPLKRTVAPAANVSSAWALCCAASPIAPLWAGSSAQRKAQDAPALRRNNSFGGHVPIADLVPGPSGTNGSWQAPGAAPTGRCAPHHTPISALVPPLRTTSAPKRPAEAGPGVPEQEHAGDGRSVKRARRGSETPSSTAGSTSDDLPGAAAELERLASGETAGPSGRAEDDEVVLVWDLDETLIIFHSLLNGAYAAARGATPDSKAAANSKALGTRWQDAIFDLCDHHLLFEQIEAHEAMHLDDVAHAAPAPTSDPPPSFAALRAGADGFTAACPGSDEHLAGLARRYAYIRGRYAEGLDAVLAEQPDVLGQYKALLRETDAHCDAWVSRAGALLSSLRSTGLRLPSGNDATSDATSVDGAAPGAASPSRGGRHARVRHVLVTAGQMAPTLAKLLLYGLDGAFSPEDIYSAAAAPKAAAFARIAERWPAARFVAIGDGEEELRAAAAMGWPAVRVSIGAAASEGPCGSAPPSAAELNKPRRIDGVTPDLLEGALALGRAPAS